MKRKEEAMKKYIASFLAICMIFVMVPILPAEAAGLEDTERVEILELVESYAACFESCKLHRYCNWCRRTSLRAMSNGCRIACKKW